VLFATNEGGSSKGVRRGGRSTAAAAAVVEEWRRECDRVRLEVVSRRDVRSGVAKQRRQHAKAGRWSWQPVHRPLRRRVVAWQ
jgi:hypothetical protein